MNYHKKQELLSPEFRAAIERTFTNIRRLSEPDTSSRKAVLRFVGSMTVDEVLRLQLSDEGLVQFFDAVKVLQGRKVID